MKKIFTLVLALVASALSTLAADILYFGDTPVQDGATYTTYPVVEIEDGDYIEYIQDSNLFYHGAIGQRFTVEVTSTAPVQFCFGNFCTQTKANETMTKTGNLTSEVQSALIDCTGELENLVPNTVHVKVTSAGTTVSCTVIFSTDPNGAGISAPANEEYIRLAAGNTLAYNVNGASTLQLYAITGAQVGSYHIDGKGTLNLGSLPKGVYIYTDGSHKGKFVVR